MIPYSILDLATIYENKTARDAFLRAKKLAQSAEREGYTRYWVAEHHNMKNIASSATTVLMGYLAENTKTLTIGSGGVMLPNHAPLIVAENFGTLESLYPGRIDCGLGRAPGTDPLTSYALRRDPQRAVRFREEVRELIHYFAPLESQTVQAIPGAGLSIPIWILGSSPSSAYLAGELGLPYVFAAHFAPTHLKEALTLYQESFKPSSTLSTPYSMLCLVAVTAQTTKKAYYHFTTLQQSFRNLVRGDIRLSPPPVNNMADHWSPLEKRHVEQMINLAIVGDEEKVQDELRAIIEKTKVNEVMFTSQIYNEEAQHDSYQRLAKIMRHLSQ